MVAPAQAPVTPKFCDNMDCYNSIPSSSQRTVEDKIKLFICKHCAFCQTCAPEINECIECKETRVTVVSPKPNKVVARMAVGNAGVSQGLKSASKIGKYLKIATTIAIIASIAFALLLLL